LVVAHFVPSVLLMVLGLGSVFAQRWARHLLLAAATLAFAVWGAVFAAWLIFAVSDGRWSHDLGEFVRSGLLGLAVLAVPWLLIAAYSPPDVRETCEARHANPSWTDHRPGGVLVLVILCFVLAAQCLLRAGDTAFPAFGMLLDGSSGQWAWWTAAAWFCIAGVLNILPSLAGWWMAFIGITALVVTFVWTALLGEDRLISAWWRIESISVTDAGLLAGGLFLLALMLLGSVLSHFQKPQHA
jgi:hypothetical protein